MNQLVTTRKIIIFLSTWILAGICLTFFVLAVIQLWDFQVNLGVFLDFRIYIASFFWFAFGVSMLISLLIAYLILRYFEKKMLSTKGVVAFLIAWPLTAFLIDFLIILIVYGILYAIFINVGAIEGPNLWLFINDFFWQLFGVCFLITPFLLKVIANLID